MNPLPPSSTLPTTPQLPVLKVDHFWNTLKNIFEKYSSIAFSTRDEGIYLQIALQELDLYLENQPESPSPTHREISELLAKDSTNFLLRSAARHNKFNLTQFLLLHPQIDINKEDDFFKITPLSCACSHGNEHIVRLLLTYPEININKADLNGRTPLRRACYEGKKKIVELLLSHHQIDVNRADNNNNTPLIITCVEGYEEIVELLLTHPQIDINKADNSGSTPLYLACSRGDKKIIQMLLAHLQIDINKAHNDGGTPLLNAFHTGQKKIAECLLLQPSTDANVHVLGQKSLSIIAQEKGWTHIAEVLRECFGIDANTVRGPGAVTAHQSVLSHVLSKDPPEWASFKHLAREQSTLFSSRLFGLMVFLCDDFLTLKPPATSNDYLIYRFFKIATQLPMEVQMILARRTFHSINDNILLKASETAFRYLAKTFSLADPTL